MTPLVTGCRVEVHETVFFSMLLGSPGGRPYQVLKGTLLDIMEVKNTGTWKLIRYYPLWPCFVRSDPVPAPVPADLEPSPISYQ